MNKIQNLEWLVLGLDEKKIMIRLKREKKEKKENTCRIHFINLKKILSKIIVKSTISSYSHYLS